MMLKVMIIGYSLFGVQHVAQRHLWVYLDHASSWQRIPMATL